MVCSLPSVTTGSGDRANVPLIIIIIISLYIIGHRKFLFCFISHFLPIDAVSLSGISIDYVRNAEETSVLRYATTLSNA